MSTKTPATKLGLYITPERDRTYRDYFHLRAHVVTIGTTGYERRRIDDTPDYRPTVRPDTIRNVDDRASDDTGGLLLGNLRASCQGCSDDTPRHVYGFDVEYRDVFGVDRRAAEAMAKTLRTIEQRMDKLAEKYGRPGTFGQYLGRLAAAVKADAFVFTDRDVRGTASYSEREHRITTVADGIAQVDRFTDAWVREPELAAAQAASAAARYETADPSDDSGADFLRRTGVQE